jgi:hypothetical protein
MLSPSNAPVFSNLKARMNRWDLKSKFVFFRLTFAGSLLFARQTRCADVPARTFDAPNRLKASVKTIAPYAQPAGLQIVSQRNSVLGNVKILNLSDDETLLRQTV